MPLHYHPYCTSKLRNTHATSKDFGTALVCRNCWFWFHRCNPPSVPCLAICLRNAFSHSVILLSSVQQVWHFRAQPSLKHIKNISITTASQQLFPNYLNVMSYFFNFYFYFPDHLNVDNNTPKAAKLRHMPLFYAFWKDPTAYDSIYFLELKQRQQLQLIFVAGIHSGMRLTTARLLAASLPALIILSQVPPLKGWIMSLVSIADTCDTVQISNPSCRSTPNFPTVFPNVYRSAHFLLHIPWPHILPYCTILESHPSKAQQCQWTQ